MIHALRMLYVCVYIYALYHLLFIMLIGSDILFNSQILDLEDTPINLFLLDHYGFRYPTFFDDIAARLLPIIPLIIYRLIENDAMDAADRVLQVYSTFLHYYPLNFTFVRDILAYFYGHLPGKLILRILNILDIKKVMMVDAFCNLLIVFALLF